MQLLPHQGRGRYVWLNIAFTTQGKGGWLESLTTGGGAEAAAQALDKKVFRSQKAYENARDTGYLHQVREVEK